LRERKFYFRKLFLSKEEQHNFVSSAREDKIFLFLFKENILQRNYYEKFERKIEN